MRLLKCLVFFFLCVNSSGQSKNLSYNLESGTSVSYGRNTPFWFLSNQYGLITPEKFNFFLKTGFSTPLDSVRNFDIAYGIDVVSKYNNKYDAYLQQCYVKAKLWFTQIHAGNIEEKFGNQSDLSSGGILWSGNARPFPKVGMKIPEYIILPFTKRYLEFKGGISHGWFGDNEFTKNTWLHHKYIYLKAGGKLPVHIHFGFHHYAQWGGESKDTIGKLPSRFEDFIKVFFASSGEGSIPSKLNEGSNKIGNHIGSRNYGLDIRLKKYKIATYWQTIFEDGTGRAGRSMADGLWGISLLATNSQRILNGITIEYLSTTDQSGPSHDSIAGFPKGGGNDNYFNNWIYRQGWTFRDNTIGTPFITSPSLYRGDASDFIRNNKVKAIHIGLAGNYKKMDYKVYYTYSRNFGTNNYAIDPYKEQNSFFIQTSFSRILPWNINLRVDLSRDFGEMYGHNSGILFTFIKKGIF